MKLVTFHGREKRRYRIGKLSSNGRIIDLTPLVSEGDLTEAGVLECFDLDSGFLEKARGGGPAIELDRSDVIVCAPVPRPGKIICIGLNYRDHAAESGMAIPESPVIFSKFSSCAIGSGAPIVIPQGSSQTDY